MCVLILSTLRVCKVACACVCAHTLNAACLQGRVCVCVFVCGGVCCNDFDSCLKPQDHCPRQVESLRILLDSTRNDLSNLEIQLANVSPLLAWLGLAGAIRRGAAYQNDPTKIPRL